MSKRYNQVIRVWGQDERLEAFVWRRKLYRGWWQKNPKQRRYALVAASTGHGHGVFELYYECLLMSIEK